MPITAPIDGPPPSPETDPAAAREVGRPSSQVAQLTAGQNTAMPAGPDLSGILVLGQKIVEGLLALAQAAPSIAGDMDQAQGIVMNALGKFSSQAATSPGTSPSMPLATPLPGGAPAGGGGGAPAAPGGPPPQGQVVTQAGVQFPGAVGGSSRAF